jgi:DNA repair photolyase
MDNQEEYRARIEAQMNNFHENLEQIIAKAKEKEHTHSQVHVENLLTKKKDAKAKLKELNEAHESEHPKLRSEMDRLFENIDEDLREALAYYF